MVDQPQTAIQAPAEHIVVARRNKESWPGESWRSADQRFQIFVAFADCMSEQADLRGVAGDAAKMPDYGSRVARNRVDQFGAAIEAVHAAAHYIASGEISLRRQPHLVACKFDSAARLA